SEQDRVDDLGQHQPALRVQQRTVPNLAVPDALRRAVGRELVRGALQGLPLLQDAERDVEEAQVVGQRLALEALLDETGQIARILHRQLHLLLLREREDGRRPQGAVEVEVQIRLRQRLQERAR